MDQQMDPQSPTETASQNATGTGATVSQMKAKPDEKLKQEYALWKEKISQSKKWRDRALKQWKTNVEYRRGKPFEVVPEADTINVPVDWSRTKNKQAQLFFQVPDVSLRGRNPQTKAAAPVAQAALNFQLQEEIHAEKVMDECMADVINAAGFAVAMVGYDVTTEPVPLPTADPTMITPVQQQLFASMGPQPTTTVERPVYECYYMERVSPAAFLRPMEFIGTDWQKAEWLGRDGLIPLAEAVRRQWVDDTYESTNADKLKTLNAETQEQDAKPIGKYVSYQQIWYRKCMRDAECKDPRQIGYLVFVDGKDDPVVDEDFKWQKYDPSTRTWLGMIDFPLKVLTLTTISDEAVPPSDSEIGRPQVKELIRFRSQMMRQRDRSMPLRWFDVNMVDEDIIESVRKGVWQDIIPVNGPGDKALGEVARANYPRENNEFMNVIQYDLDQAWSSGPNQQGFENQGSTSATEANIMNGANQTRLEYEQAKVLSFFLELAKGTFNLMQLFSDDTKWVETVGPDMLAQFQQWDKNTIRGEFAFMAKANAALRVDTKQEKQESLDMYKLLRQDPLVNPKVITAAVLEAHDIDPTTALVEPQPPQPPPMNYRMTVKAEDMINPLVVAMVQKDHPVSIADLTEARKIMKAAGIPVQADPTEQPGVPEGNTPGDTSGGQPADAEHGGPPPQVQPLNQRYEGPQQQGE